MNVVIKGDHTIGNLLRTELLDNSDFCAYKQTHPLKDTIELHIVSTNPQKLLESVKTKLIKNLKNINYEH